jgi:hypothetical protein
MLRQRLRGRKGSSGQHDESPFKNGFLKITRQKSEEAKKEVKIKVE